MNISQKQIGITIGVVGVLAIVLGAFGAHSLKEVLSPDRLISYKTGITYHFYHLFAMLFAGNLIRSQESKYSKYAFVFFLFGTILFSGSIYLLACRDIIGLVTYKWLGPITPIGGLFFIVGWIFLGLAIYKQKG